MTVDQNAPTVFVVDDDASVRRALQRLLLAADYQVATFASAEEFLAVTDLAHPSCLLADVRMPNVQGLELQETLRATNRALPVILISGHADAATVARAKAAGAVAFLSKPFDDATLFAAVERAIAQDRAQHGYPVMTEDVEQPSRVAVLAHEMSQPLMAIRLNADAALRSLTQSGREDPALQRVLQEIVESSERALEIMTSLRALDN